MITSINVCNLCKNKLFPYNQQYQISKTKNVMIRGRFQIKDFTSVEKI